MRPISLDGTWELRCFPEGTCDVVSPADLAAAGLEAIEATVPGNVELDLVRAGRLPDPFVGTNILELADYEHHEWWLRRTFATPERRDDEHAVLCFEGLDCFATVWLNGHEVGRTANMLIPHEMEATDALRPTGEDNELVVRLGSAVRAAAEETIDPLVSALPSNIESARVRKAPHMYGWDIAPRVVSAGIWRSVSLQLRGPLTIGHVYAYTDSASEGHASLGINWQFRVRDGADWRGCQLRIAGVCGDSRFDHTVPCRFAAGNMVFGIPDPRLWWPKGYGEQSLYVLTAQLVRDDEVLDEQRFRVGLRTLELVRTDTTTREQPGEFLFKVNGTPILCKGSNWVPADAFHSRDADRVPRILALFADLGCNMLRCWGGNVYEDHAFYDLCDEYGILVWQDFAMACGRYPQDDVFLERMRVEAETIVRRLRNHPCIALWAGDNECDESNFWGGRFDPNANRITRHVLPEVVRRCDPRRPYLPSSPYIAPAVYAARDRSLMPEQHLWGPRDYYKSRFYTEATAHFVSEIGYHGCPCTDTLREFLAPDALWPQRGTAAHGCADEGGAHDGTGGGACATRPWRDNEQWRIHAADTSPQPGPYAYRTELMAKQIREMFGAEAESLEDFVLASQICQAEAKKFFVEMTRLKKWRRTGVLWWNVMDCWPQFSDAIVDHAFRRKLAYLYLRRVQRPACIMMDEPDNWVSRVVLGNDSREAVAGTFAIRDADSGETVLDGVAEAGPNANQQLGTIRASRGDQRLFLIDWELNGEKGRNHYLLGTPPFDLARYRSWLAALAPCTASELVAQGLPWQ